MAKSSHRNCAQIRLVKPHGTKFPWFLRSERPSITLPSILLGVALSISFFVGYTLRCEIQFLILSTWISCLGQYWLTTRAVLVEKKWTSLLIVGDHGKMGPELGRNGAHPLMTVWKLTQLQKQLKKRSCSLSDAAIFKFFKIIKNSIWLHFAAWFFVDVLYCAPDLTQCG